ncbi:MAG: helix-turn-helix domain-containing protein [Thermoproteota archaeon]
MQAVYIVDEVSIARVLVDPMRRAILHLLREQPMTQAQLAEELGLSNASLNYHMKILLQNKLVEITKSVAEEHGIMQKFFSPAAFLFVYDLDAMPKDVARYFYPISLERARTLVSTIMIEGVETPSSIKKVLRHKNIEEVSASLSRLLVSVAKQYTRQRALHGDEKIVSEIYTKVFKVFLGQQQAPAHGKPKGQ